MDTFVCKVCRHIAFDNAPVDCPVCGVPIENFEKDLDVIRKTDDPDSLNDIEKMHIPVISLESETGTSSDDNLVSVKVQVGEVSHVMESEHFVRFLDFYQDRTFLARILFTYRKPYPAASIVLKKEPGLLSVIENCSVHGYWMAGMMLKELA